MMVKVGKDTEGSIYVNPDNVAWIESLGQRTTKIVFNCAMQLSCPAIKIGDVDALVEKINN